MSQNGTVGETKPQVELPAQLIVQSLQQQVADQAFRIAVLEATIAFERGERTTEPS